MQKATVNQILGVGEPEVELGDLLFSDQDQRERWVESWLEGEPESSQVDRRELEKRVNALFSFARDAMQSDQNRKSITSPADVIVKLARERYPYPSFHWVVWPLDAEKHHMFELTEHGSRRYLRQVSKLVPSRDELAPVPIGGGYLLLYMGPPEAALEKEGARRALAELCRQVTVFDVLYRKYSGPDRILYSTRAGEGYFKAKDGTESTCEFPAGVDLSWFQVTKRGVR